MPFNANAFQKDIIMYGFPDSWLLYSLVTKYPKAKDQVAFFFFWPDIIPRNSEEKES